MELKKQISWSEAKPSMLHYRTQTGQEVDAVLEDASGRVVGIEIKAAKSVGGQDFSGLLSLAETAGSRFIRGIVLYDGTETISFGNNLYALPVNSLWSQEYS